MNINRLDYDNVFSHAENLYKKTENWNEVRSLSYYYEPYSTTDREQILQLLKPIFFLTVPLNVEIWDTIVDQLEEEAKSETITKIGSHVRNNAKIPTSQGSSWQTYKSKLENQNWTSESIKGIEKSAFQTLQNFTTDNKDGPVKGLVIGNVQSGKTANMIGLMTLAADNGFNFFIVLTGVIDSLRKQTHQRMHSDLTYKSHNNSWHHIDNPSSRFPIPEHDLSTFKLSKSSKEKYYSVLLKNYSRLENFIQWIKNSDSEKSKQLKILIIDDEADQASINTNKINEEDPTRINNLITQLVHLDNVKAVNYVAYTATPYANILNESGSESLYPKDFIYMLPENGDYIGPQQIFHLEEPELSPAIDIVQPIYDLERDLVIDIQEGNTNQELPQSFKEAINWFLLSVAAMRSQNYRKPISMLIHTSFRIYEHENIAEAVESYLYKLRENFADHITSLREQYIDQSNYMSRQQFIEGMENYSAVDEIPDYPDWEDVLSQLSTMMRLKDEEFLSHIPLDESGGLEYHKGIHLTIDNSKPRSVSQEVRLVYPSKNKLPGLAPAFIVIGGNTLSRGLTLEGLVSSYFLRTTNQADTLMQMGRWFGYRRGYEIYPRVWLDRKARERFDFITQMNYELREEVEEKAALGYSPSEYARTVKNSPNREFLRITSDNKAQSAIASEYNFSGYSAQTVYFEEDASILKHNFELSKSFLNSLGNPDNIKDSHLVWKDISKESVRNFIEDYKVYDNDIKLSNLGAVLDWIDEVSQKSEDPINNWNVVHSSLKNIQDSVPDSSGWEISGYYPKAVNRSRLLERSSDGVTNIGVLRAITDQISDIDVDSEQINKELKDGIRKSDITRIRKEYGVDRTPLLVIYRIDKNSKPRINNSKREALDLAVDPIGIFILMPGFSNGNPVAKLSIKLPEKIEKEDSEDDFLSEDDEKLKLNML